MSLFSSNDEHYSTPFALHNKNARRNEIETSRLEPENDVGNVEYKLRLTDSSPGRIERLVTQLKWRIAEGHGEAIIYLGVKDDGQFVGLTPDEVKISLQTLEQMSNKIGAKMTIVSEKIVEVIAELADEKDEADDDSTNTLDNQQCVKGKAIRIKAIQSSKHKENSFSQSTTSPVVSTTTTTTTKTSTPATTIIHYPEEGENKTKKLAAHNNNNNNGNNRKISKEQSSLAIRKVIQVLVKRKTHDISEELRVAVLGPTESGKSSLLGVLTRGEYDNGRGSARLNLFRHRHEIRSGHTSSISQEIFGFASNGKPLTYYTCLTTEEIIESSSKIVTLIDLAGHQRYLSTTLFGLGSYSPDFVLLVVSAISPITNVTTDHISLALGMEKSLAIVINKIDLASKEDQESCFNDIVEALHELHPEVVPFRIVNLEDAIVAASKIIETKCLPIFFTSCVTGLGLNSLYGFFNEVSPSLNFGDLNHAVSQSSELQVDETFEVPGIGTVVSGLMVEGIIREGDEMLLGPDDRGNFSTVSIASLQRHKIPCNFARAGQKCTMAIVGNDVNVRRGMVMKEMDHDWTQSFSICLQFQACVKLIITNKKQQKLNRGCQVSVFVANVKQTCNIQSICQTTNNSWLVDLKLTKRPEYIREGSRIIIRHASIKGIGTVIKVIPMSRKGDRS